jgi:hypothetical protein
MSRYRNYIYLSLSLSLCPSRAIAHTQILSYRDISHTHHLDMIVYSREFGRWDVEGSEERNIRESCMQKYHRLEREGGGGYEFNPGWRDGGGTCASKGCCDTESFGRISENRGDNISLWKQ